MGLFNNELFQFALLHGPMLPSGQGVKFALLPGTVDGCR